MSKRTSKPNLSLFLNSGTDYSIQCELGRIWTIEEAKAAWEAGHVTDCNMSFRRLAQFGFDVEALKQHYASGKR